MHATVVWETSLPSLSSSPWILGAPRSTVLWSPPRATAVPRLLRSAAWRATATGLPRAPGRLGKGGRKGPGLSVGNVVAKKLNKLLIGEMRPDLQENHKSMILMLFSLTWVWIS